MSSLFFYVAKEAAIARLCKGRYSKLFVIYYSKIYSQLYSQFYSLPCLIMPKPSAKRLRKA